MCAFGSRNDAFGAGEEHACLEGLQLRNIHTLHQAVLQELADDDTCTVIAETAGVDVAGLEVVT